MQQKVNSLYTSPFKRSFPLYNPEKYRSQKSQMLIELNNVENFPNFNIIEK